MNSLNSQAFNLVQQIFTEVPYSEQALQLGLERGHG